MAASDLDSYTFMTVLPFAELAAGERLFIEVGTEPIVIFNVGGDIFAIGDRCTHDDGPLGDGDVDDHTVTCPRHGAKFDLRNGKALTLPAVMPTTSFPTRVVEGMIEIGIPNRE